MKKKVDDFKKNFRFPRFLLFSGVSPPRKIDSSRKAYKDEDEDNIQINTLNHK